MAKRSGSKALEEEEKRAINKTNLKKLFSIFRFVWPYKVTFILGMACLVVSSSVLLSLPFVVGKIVDEAKGESEWFIQGIDNIALLLFAILLVQSVFSFFRVYLFALFSEKGMADIRLELYRRFLTLPLTFYDNRRVGEMISRMTSDVSLLQSVFSTTLAELFRQVITLIGGIVLIFVLATKLSLFMLSTFPIILIGAMLFGKFIRKMSKKTQDELAKTNVIVEETLQSIHSVKSFVNEHFEYGRYHEAIKNTVGLAIKTSTYSGLFISFIILFLFGGIIAVIWYGATLVEANEMTIGELTSFVFYTMFMGGSIAGIGSIYTQVQRAIGSSERAMEILEEGMEAPLGDESETRTLSLQGNVRFENVGFAYPTRSDVDVLKKITFDIAQGEKIALVGPSGAGKSTIIQLLMRFYELNEGSIWVDDKDIRQMDLRAYRNNIGIVPQEIILFGGSIKENIAYGKPSASMEEIKEAAKKANALDFILQFPEGFDTLVGERGVKLSGGQRQRLAIARAILKDPRILILDEATSSLDAESEALVQSALNTLMENRTTIIIAHRLATIREVDRIFVIKAGEIVEAGNHRELSHKEEGLYSNLVKLQFEVEE